MAVARPGGCELAGSGAPLSDDTTGITVIPRARESYPSGADQTLAADLAMRVRIEPFNAIATGVFFPAILHTFAAARFAVKRLVRRNSP
jgi:hypothetical protein